VQEKVTFFFHSNVGFVGFFLRVAMQVEPAHLGLIRTWLAKYKSNWLVLHFQRELNSLAGGALGAEWMKAP